MTKESLPSAFIWRRLHSLTGLWLVGFLFFHLMTNSQAGLFVGDDGKSFIHSVTAIHDTPYLALLETLILAVPILIHAIWGIQYLLTAKMNSFGDTGHTPYLPEYPRNRAYTWQRITSWLLVVGILAHIIHMRFIEYPTTLEKNVPQVGTEHSYMVKVTEDSGLASVASRLGVTLYAAHQMAEEEYDVSLKDNERMAVSKNFGTAELLMLRNTFKIPIMLALYTLLVLTACFHAFNGLWTGMISWGITLTQRSQTIMRQVTILLMVVTALFGLSAIWLTYWINLRN